MSKNLLYRLCHFSTELHPLLQLRNIILVQLILFILVFQGCAFFKSRQKIQRYFTQDDIENIIQDLKKQQDIVSEFYSTGKLSINGWILDTSADIFVAGKREPLMLKIEISHSWGKPLFYFLIKEGKLEIRDFIEKKQYIGDFTPDNFSRFLPNMDFSPDMICSFLRGYPHFFPYTHIYEKSPGVLNLEDSKQNTLGTIDFSPGKGIKKAVSSPPRFPGIKYTDFRQSGDIEYAEKTVVEDIKGRKDLTFKRKKAVFNKDIPDSIFTLKNKPFFEVIDLDN